MVKCPVLSSIFRSGRESIPIPSTPTKKLNTELIQSSLLVISEFEHTLQTEHFHHYTIILYNDTGYGQISHSLVQFLSKYLLKKIREP